MCILDRLTKRHDTVDTVHFVISKLRLDRRNDVIDGIDQKTVIIKDRHSRSHLHICAFTAVFFMFLSFVQPFV